MCHASDAHVSGVIHFTDWVVGHAHLVMFGVFSMWLLGIMTYLFPRLWRTEWYSRELCEWHFWLSAVGVFVMAVDLILAGLFQGYLLGLAAAVGRVGRRLAAVLDVCGSWPGWRCSPANCVLPTTCTARGKLSRLGPAPVSRQQGRPCRKPRNVVSRSIRRGIVSDV